MELVEAWAALGLAPGAGWEEVRASYRRLIRATHPDLAGAGSTRRAAQLNQAYTTLVLARREGRLHAPPPRTGTTAATRPPRGKPATAGPVEVLEGGTIRLSAGLPEAFARVLDAAHRIGEVTYVDRSAPILEAVLQLEGVGTCSLVVSFQDRPGGTEAYCTLEAIERVAQPPVHHVVAALVAAL